MSTPLIDIDANSRQSGFKPTKMGSKIPSPPKFQRTDSADRCAPLSVSTTGSPSYIAMPTDATAVVSLTPISKLPRKLTPSQSAFSKSYMYGSRPATPHTSLPRPRNWQKPAASSSNSTKTTPPLSCNKPLPSPPIAQIVNPTSPPKAQRTLVDAEAGTPTEEVWSVIQPENVTPTRSPAPSTGGMVSQKSASEGSALRHNGIPVLKSRGTTPSVSNSTPSQTGEWSGEEEKSGRSRPRVMTEPRLFSPMNPYAKLFHAYSTDSNVAMDSPLVHKQQTLPAMAIPPRISSKRDFLPSPDTAADEVHEQLSNSLRPAKSGCTKWPNLAVAEERKVPVDGETLVRDRYLTAEPENDQPVSFDGADVTQSHYGSIDSVSTWSLAAGSSLEDEAEVNYKGSVRVKRLSWHSSNPGTGPTLRIFADADAVLLGRYESIPAVPAVPENMLRKPSHQRYNGTLPGQTETIGSRPVKITPIRSMQPPRKPSTEDLLKRSPSLNILASTEVAQSQKMLDASQTHPHGSVEVSQESVSLHINETLDISTEDRLVTESKLSTVSVASAEFSKNAYEAGNYSTTLQDGVPQKAAQVLGTKADTPQSATRKCLPMTWMTPKSATFTVKKSAAIRSKTSRLLSSTERVDNRVSAISTRSPSSASSNLARSVPSQAGARQMGPSRLEVSESVAQDLDSIHYDKSNNGPATDEQAAANKTLRLRAKCSFKNVFGRRDPKATPQPVKDQNSKRSSVASSALAQRIRNPTNFSKVSLARPSTAEAEIKEDVVVCADSVEVLSTEQDRQAALAALEPTTEIVPDASAQPAPLAQCETAAVIHNILDCVTSMKKDSPDCLRGLEIAEAVLHAVDCSKQANLSAELARKHARDAELNAEHVGIELQRLERLCKPSFDNETMQAVRQLIVVSGGVAP
ncbi:hypothetical protein E8E11_002900 [Didymella keratinophila]|nr:hypothetical protein E8E11_002900 [Didymella keratinophila]